VAQGTDLSPPSFDEHWRQSTSDLNFHWSMVNAKWTDTICGSVAMDRPTSFSDRSYFASCAAR